MNRETFLIDKNLLDNLVKENIRLRARVEELEAKQPIKPQIMENQISIEEYIKTLKKGKKKK
jgi:BMFP domain-containing protein YqiC